MVIQLLAFACRHGKEEVTEYLLGQIARIEGAYGPPVTVVHTPSTRRRIFGTLGGASTAKVEPTVKPNPEPEPYGPHVSVVHTPSTIRRVVMTLRGASASKVEPND